MVKLNRYQLSFPYLSVLVHRYLYKYLSLKHNLFLEIYILSMHFHRCKSDLNPPIGAIYVTVLLSIIILILL